MAEPLNRHSRTITQGPDRAPSRAMLKAVGLTDDDLNKPLVGIANTWIEVMPCNFHLRRLSARVKEGVRAAGGTPIEFNTVAVSDGVSMGTEGMKASLISREVIADSIELVTRGHLFDAVVALSGCDKTIPGTVMALARLDLPSLMLYGGSIMPGRFQGRDVTIQDVFEGVGAHAAKKMTDAELLDLESNACPGPGACGGQFTANTMATAFEILGISPIGSASVPAMDDSKDDVAYRVGEMVMDLVRKNLTARQVITRAALTNAVASIAATGGSTNGVLHLLGVAREAEVDLRIDDFDLFECNEAFASVPMAWMKEHDIPHEKVNVNGGAIALGHPIGCTGARLMTTMLNELERTGGRWGLQTMCEGGGQANVTILVQVCSKRNFFHIDASCVTRINPIQLTN